MKWGSYIHLTGNKWVKAKGTENESSEMDCQQEKKKEQQRSECIWSILDLSPLSFPFSLHPPPFLLTRFLFHFRCNLPPSSLLASLFLPLSVPLSAYVWWYQCSGTPPLTDNSLDGTLLCTVQCTAILPQWAPDLWRMYRITPTAVSGTCQTEGRGGYGWLSSNEGG